MVDGSASMANNASLRCALVCRWIDLGLLFLTALGVGMVICPSLEIGQQRVTNLLLPWGWAGGVFVGLVAAAGAWVLLRLLGANLRSVRTWKTNPPAWPAGIVAFAFCSFLWQCCASPERMSAGTWAIQGLGAIVLFLSGGLLVSFAAGISRGAARKTVDNQGSETAKDLDELVVSA
jgi:hypothetical protein